VLTVLASVEAHRMREKPRIGPQHVIVVLAALAAELDGDEDPPAARLHLALQGELAPLARFAFCGFQCGKQCTALADELMQLEGEGPPAAVAQ
jgi:hypothetical protein